MRTTSRKGIVLVLALGLASILAVSPPANAAVFIECNLSAATTQSKIDENTYDWDVLMIGQCQGDNEGVYSAFGSADGTSNGLGLCDAAETGFIEMRDLDLDVLLFIDSVGGPLLSKFLHERWFAPITTYPVATPFLIEDVSGPTPSLDGAGTLLSHIFLNCNGSPSTLILNLRLA